MTPQALRAPRTRSDGSDARRPRTAFVFSGGASLGALQVGMLEALYEQGVRPDMLVGTSAGALNAAFVASRPQTTATAAALGSVWLSLQRDDIFPVSLSTLVGGLCGRRDHLVPARGLRQLVQRYVGFEDLADSPIPLHLVAFDLSKGCEVLLSQGPAVESVLAAASIPGVFPPVAIAGRRLIDGGVVNNTPISHAVGLGAARIYVLPTEDPSGQRAEDTPHTALDAAIRGVRLLVKNRLEADLVRYALEAELIVLPAPNLRAVQPTSFGHAARLMTDARIAARTALARQPLGRQLSLAS
jgi:NTE family protein